MSDPGTEDEAPPPLQDAADAAAPTGSSLADNIISQANAAPRGNAEAERAEAMWRSLGTGAALGDGTAAGGAPAAAPEAPPLDIRVTFFADGFIVENPEADKAAAAPAPAPEARRSGLATLGDSRGAKPSRPKLPDLRPFDAPESREFLAALERNHVPRELRSSDALGRAESLPVGTCAMFFKRTVPACQRCRNQPRRCSYGRDPKDRPSAGSRPFRPMASRAAALWASLAATDRGRRPQEMGRARRVRFVVDDARPLPCPWGEGSPLAGELRQAMARQEAQAASAAPPAAFQGAGQTLGGSSAAPAAAPVVELPDAPVVDATKPAVKIRVRLAGGKALTATLNADHTVAHLRAVIAANGGGETPYDLLAGFPPKPLADASATVADLNGQAVQMKLRG